MRRGYNESAFVLITKHFMQIEKNIYKQYFNQLEAFIQFDDNKGAFVSKGPVLSLSKGEGNRTLCGRARV